MLSKCTYKYNKKHDTSLLYKVNYMKMKYTARGPPVALPRTPSPNTINGTTARGPPVASPRTPSPNTITQQYQQHRLQRTPLDKLNGIIAYNKIIKN